VKITDDPVTSRYPKILLYGPQGCGKSHFSALAPRPLLYLDFENGAGFLPLVMDMTGIRMVNDIAASEIVSLLDGVTNDVANSPYRTIVFDTLSEAQTLHRESVVGTRKAATKDDWGQNTEYMRKVVRRLQSAEIVVVYICHEDSTQDWDGLHLHPALTPALLGSVIGYVDILAYMSSRLIVDDKGKTSIERTLLVEPTDRVRAKQRGSRLPPRVLQPTWENTFASLYPATDEEPVAPKAAPKRRR
jgi:hypothetical protein